MDLKIPLWDGKAKRLLQNTLSTGENNVIAPIHVWLLTYSSRIKKKWRSCSKINFSTGKSNVTPPVDLRTPMLCGEEAINLLQNTLWAVRNNYRVFTCHCGVKKKLRTYAVLRIETEFRIQIVAVKSLAAKSSLWKTFLAKK